VHQSAEEVEDSGSLREGAHRPWDNSPRSDGDGGDILEEEVDLVACLEGEVDLAACLEEAEEVPPFRGVAVADQGGRQLPSFLGVEVAVQTYR
jgi:hypothetical protein